MKHLLRRYATVISEVKFYIDEGWSKKDAIAFIIYDEYESDIPENHKKELVEYFEGV